MYQKQGFTLIELLVVVLIIGILASVALPQYQKAVIKSRYVSHMNWVDSLVQAQEVFYLANGRYATRFEELDITIPTDLTQRHVTDKEEVLYTQTGGEKHFALGVSNSNAWFEMGTAYGRMTYTHYYSATGAKRLCYAWIDSDLLGGMCQSLGGTLTQVVPGAWHIYRLP